VACLCNRSSTSSCDGNIYANFTIGYHGNMAHNWMKNRWKKARKNLLKMATASSIFESGNGMYRQPFRTHSRRFALCLEWVRWYYHFWMQRFSGKQPWHMRASFLVNMVTTDEYVLPRKYGQKDFPADGNSIEYLWIWQWYVQATTPDRLQKICSMSRAS